jgi:hypothetical protein
MHRNELYREGSVMALYVSIVLLAALLALPDSIVDTTAIGPKLLTIIWGTTLGLALAHWFAFYLAAAAARGGRPSRDDRVSGVVQVAAAMVVAAATSVMVVIVDRSSALDAAAIAPAAVVGATGFAAARAGGRPWSIAILAGVTALAMGLAVAAAKAWLASSK